jgi:hypothetical protein
MVIYAVVCSETLKLYIGQHRHEDDLGKYLSKKFYVANHNTSGTRSHLYNAMRKHPRECWSIWPLVFGIETKIELDECERLLIYACKCQHPDVGYNICDGGEGFTGPHTDETRRKISASTQGQQHRLGQHRKPDELAQWRAKVMGQKRSPEQRERIAAANKGKNLGNRNAAGNRTGAALVNVQAALQQKVWTPERRQAQSERIRKYNEGRRCQVSTQNQPSSM